MCQQLPPRVPLRSVVISAVASSTCTGRNRSGGGHDDDSGGDERSRHRHQYSCFALNRSRAPNASALSPLFSHRSTRFAHSARVAIVTSRADASRDNRRSGAGQDGFGRALTARRQSGVMLPAQLHPLFWEYDPRKLRWPGDRDLVIGKVLAHGTWDHLRWLRAAVSDADLRRWILRTRGRGLSSPQLRYWELVLDLPADGGQPLAFGSGASSLARKDASWRMLG